jgi:tetratricopeptide (TPR) repeat protein
MRSVLALTVLALLPVAGRAAWIETRSGPFVVYSNAGEDKARAALYHLEQFRFLFGESLGKKDLRTVWPITVVVLKPGKNPMPEAALGFSRDGWLANWPAGGAPPPSFFRQLALLFIDDNWPGRMPGDLEPTFAALFSTMQLQGGKVVIGAPPEAAARTRSWALLQYLLTNPETATRTRVLLSNLAAGADESAAFRNAFEKSKALIDAEVDRYLAAGQFLTLTLPARPLNPEIAFSIIPALPSRLRVLPGDQLMAGGAPPAVVRLAYQQAINERPGPLAFEGLGLALLAENQPAEAQKAFEAMKAQMDPTLGLFTRGLLELGLYDQASVRNPRWAEPLVRAAAKEPGPVRKAYLLKKAAELAPRNPEIWRDLAQAQFDSKQYAEAEKSWYAAARVARSDAERETLTRAREAFVQARYDAQAAERARIKKEEADEVERVRQQAMENIRKKEDALNAGAGPTGKVEKWWDGPPTQAFTGVLDSIACQGSRARLSLRDAANKPVTLVVTDPSKVVIFNQDQTQAQLACGPQKPPRRVKIEYVAKPGAPGEVATVEFLK